MQINGVYGPSFGYVGQRKHDKYQDSIVWTSFELFQIIVASLKKSDFCYNWNLPEWICWVKLLQNKLIWAIISDKFGVEIKKLRYLWMGCKSVWILVSRELNCGWRFLAENPLPKKASLKKVLHWNESQGWPLESPKLFEGPPLKWKSMWWIIKAV